MREATIGAMKEITGPILAITLVLSSVLLPSAFLGGITGQFFRQFALTISVAMIISAINAMTMTPARAAWIFGSRKPGEHGDQGKEALPWWSFALFGGLVSVWLLALDARRVAGPAGWRRAWRGGDWRPASHLADVGHLPRCSFCPVRLPAACSAGSSSGRSTGLWARLFGGFNWVFELDDASLRQERRLDVCA